MSSALGYSTAGGPRLIAMRLGLTRLLVRRGGRGGRGDATPRLLSARIDLFHSRKMKDHLRVAESVVVLDGGTAGGNRPCPEFPGGMAVRSRPAGLRLRVAGCALPPAPLWGASLNLNEVGTLQNRDTRKPTRKPPSRSRCAAKSGRWWRRVHWETPPT